MTPHKWEDTFLTDFELPRSYGSVAYICRRCKLRTIADYNMFSKEIIHPPPFKMNDVFEINLMSVS
jgi:hypothetical protein